MKLVNDEFYEIFCSCISCPKFPICNCRIGRKKVFFIAIITLITAGILMALVPYWAAFAVLRAAVGFAHPGIFVIAVVIGLFLSYFIYGSELSIKY